MALLKMEERKKEFEERFLAAVIDAKVDFNVKALSAFFKTHLHTLPCIWIPFGTVDDEHYRGTCRLRDLGGFCSDNVEYINVLLPKRCLGGRESFHDEHASGIFDENLSCKRHAEQRFLHPTEKYYHDIPLEIYEELYFPSVIKQLTV
mgnify:FL=1